MIETLQDYTMRQDAALPLFAQANLPVHGISQVTQNLEAADELQSHRPNLALFHTD